MAGSNHPERLAHVAPAISSAFTGRLLLVLAIVVGLTVAWLARGILLLIFAGILFAVVLDGLTGLIVRRAPVPRGLALGLVLLSLATLVGLGVSLLGSELAQQADQLSETLTKSIQQGRSVLEQYGWGKSLLGTGSPGQPPAAPSAGLMTRAASLISSGVGAIAAPLIVLVIGIYTAIDPTLYRRGFLALIPAARRARAEEVLGASASALRGWLLGRLFSMSVIALTTGLGLWFLGIPMWLSLAVIAFVFNFIPYIGPLLSAVPAILIALSVGGTEAIYVAVLYSVIQLAETYLLTPLVEQYAVSIPPALGLSTQMIFALLFGILGMLLATPLLAVVMVLVKMLYIEDTLGEETPPLTES
jgi:predicted PurR-regulated permease PerM